MDSYSEDIWTQRVKSKVDVSQIKDLDSFIQELKGLQSQDPNYSKQIDVLIKHADEFIDGSGNLQDSMVDNITADIKSASTKEQLEAIKIPSQLSTVRQQILQRAKDEKGATFYKSIIKEADTIRGLGTARRRIEKAGLSESEKEELERQAKAKEDKIRKGEAAGRRTELFQSIQDIDIDSSNALDRLDSLKSTIQADGVITETQKDVLARILDSKVQLIKDNQALKQEQV